MPKRIVIVGGVAAGMSAATRARRLDEHASITVLEKGGYVSFANCGLPYYLCGRIVGRDKLLVTTPERLRQRFNLDVRVGHEVTRIDRAARVVHGIDLSGGKPFSLPYDKLVIAVGASAIVPDIPNVRAPNVFVLRSMEDTFAIENYLRQHQPRRVAIVGAGFIGLEMVEAMRQIDLDVTVIEKAPQVMPPLDPEMAAPVEKELRAHAVTLLTGTGLAALDAADGKVTHVRTEDGRQIAADMVLLSIGVRPNTKLAVDAGLAIGPAGGIAVDEYQRTSDPDIYAAGDAVEVVHGVTKQKMRIPLAGPANRQGRIAGEHAVTGVSQRAPAVLGTSIVKVFGLSVGMTGLSESAARRAALNAQTAHITGGSHAGYYPGAKPMQIKLVYEQPTGRVLGAQIVGGDGVDKRIDVIATAIHFGGTLDDLASLDLAYAPQFSSARDPVHIAAFAAQNQLRGLTHAISPMEIENELLVDVRTPGECQGGKLPGAINIPLDELRARMGELDRNKRITVYCQAGLRGYIAQRILQQHGFADVRNIKGGYSLAANLPPIRGLSAGPSPADKT